MRADVLIVGGGIVGAACAEALAAEGRDVLLVEGRFPGAGATSAAMGHVVVMDDSEPLLALTSWARRLWLERGDDLPPELELDGCGTLWIATEPGELAIVEQRHRRLAEAGVRSEPIDGAALREAEPALREGLAGGLRVPDDFTLYPPAATRWLLDRALERGARLLEGVAVAGLGEREGEARLSDGTTARASVVVLAAGHETARLLPAAPLWPRKGQLAITARAPGLLRHQVIELGYQEKASGDAARSVAFNVQPRRSGQLLVGSSRQLGDATRGIDRPLLGEMLARAIEYVPPLERLPVLRAWAGTRAVTPDKLPLIGPWPARSDLWLATAHEGLGITTSLATARLVAAGLAGRAAEIDPTPFLPARFAEARSG